MKVVVIDDEKNSRELLYTLLKEYCKISKVETASDLNEAEEIINSFKPDLVFLDIQLNGQNGFDLLQKVQSAKFLTCFATGYSEYAIKAANSHAFGYLVKPIDLDELKTVVARAQKNLDQKDKNTSESILISENNETWIIDVKDILYISSNSSYTFVHMTDDKRIISSKSLTYFEGFLPSTVFIRSHRSYILNLNGISSVKDGRTAIATLKNGIEIPIANRRKKDFNQLFNAFITSK